LCDVCRFRIPGLAEWKSGRAEERKSGGGRSGSSSPPLIHSSALPPTPNAARPTPNASSELALRMKRFSVKHFMDAWTLNVERLQQCCVHVGSAAEGHPRIPFCARQLFGGLRELTATGAKGREELVQLDGER